MRFTCQSLFFPTTNYELNRHYLTFYDNKQLLFLKINDLSTHLISKGFGDDQKNPLF